MGFFHLADPATAVPVSFPGLGLEFAVNREALFIGPLTVYWYGIIVVTGIALGVCYAVWRGGQFGFNRDKMLDVVLYSIVAGLVGARAYYVAFSWDYYSAHPGEIVQIWKGGIAFYGGVIGALICAAILCRIWKLPLVRGADAALGGLLLGQSIGRWGNFVNVEAFGGHYEGLLRMVSPAVDNYLHAFPAALGGFTPEQVRAMSNIPVHPTFLYESAWTMLGFLFLVWYTRRRHFTGELTLLYFFINGLGRAFIEGLRTDSLMLGGMRISQLLAAAMAVVAAALWLYAMRLVRQGAAPAWMSTAPLPEAAASDAAPSDSDSDVAPGAAPDSDSGVIPTPAAENGPSPQDTAGDGQTP